VSAFRGTPIHSIASGDFHMIALAQDWTVYAWGYGAEGQCGLGTTLHLRSALRNALALLSVLAPAPDKRWLAAGVSAGRRGRWRR
jgi:hypothetical protein